MLGNVRVENRHMSESTLLESKSKSTKTSQVSLNVLSKPMNGLFISYTK